MKTIHYELNHFKIEYDLTKLGDPSSMFFLDIETTGFSPKNSEIYLIGGCYCKSGIWHMIQWFADSPEDEKEVLAAFFSFLKPYDILLHFNGNSFDLPFILERCKKYYLNENFDTYRGIDLYKRVSLWKHFLSLPNCKQKSIEQFLKIERDDLYTGGELISIYRDYLQDRSKTKEQLLLLHNKDDLKGMLQILPILAYGDLFNQTIRTTKVQSNSYIDLNGKKQQELILRIKLYSPVPIPVSYHANDCYVTLGQDTGAIRIPVYTEELKYFYDNYKDYYYLPTEDIAMHKSVAGFVDKAHRKPATAATCYTRKYSSYLPQWDYLFSPFFKREHKSSLLFFELTEEFKTNREAFSLYASHILQMLGKAH
ncbi:MAG: ribonuclease H-like domain-containing protein [Lachnospiraceae bacterium]|nr:ribonuclease H-like domain-containing protein [Lachnospiraceae bacterium]